MINICICGYGNMAHAIAANFQNHQKYNLSIYSYRKVKESYVSIIDTNFTGNTEKTLITSNPAYISRADIVILCVPSHLRKSALKSIASYIQPHQVLGAFPGLSGFNAEVTEIINFPIKHFASQRVPFISRVIEKGKSVSSYKKEFINIAASYDFMSEKEQLEEFMNIKIKMLSDFDSVNLSNSNPLLHTARIYDYLKTQKKPFFVPPNTEFYKTWTQSSSETLVAMDAEFMQIIKKLNIQGTIPLLEHYQVNTTIELTSKIRSIEAFHNIYFPTKTDLDGKSRIDFQSRYFVEDFLHSLHYIQIRAEELNIKTPVINSVYDFYIKNAL